MILQKINDTEDENVVNLMLESQHGFKRSKSTTTAGLAIQSALARALDQGNFAVVANIDLSSAFDLVNINLLIKRMRIIGLPKDVVDLVEIWL